MRDQKQAGFIHLLEIIIIAIVVLGLAGYIGYRVINQRTGSVQNSLTTLPLNNTSSTGILSEDAIKQLALQKVPDATISTIALEQTSAQPIFTVKLGNGKTLLFNAKTGDEVSGTVNDDQSEGASVEIPRSTAAKLTFDQARQIAQAQNPRGVITKIELEGEDSHLVYSVRFSDGSRIDIDAVSGAVVKTQAATPNGNNASSSSNESRTTSGSSDSGKTTPTSSSSTVTPDNSNHQSGSGSGGSGSEDNSGSSGDSGSGGH
ncbi:MAG TPA: PepSY domain-containing protein [Candidatus Acidoferrum sp.]|nr:PepSY domain-containing protein [Candidatus Acidoferrum sp.]